MSIGAVRQAPSTHGRRSDDGAVRRFPYPSR